MADRNKKYSIGLDFGTLSGRCILADLETGEEVQESVMEYAHGVMDTQLADGTPLGAEWALQDPEDYLEVLRVTIRGVMSKQGIEPSQVVGLGVDFTSCSPMPILADGTPLCALPEYRSEPHAYVKLWKHHAAQAESDKLNEVAGARNEKFLQRYGGKVSSEWIVPKLWQVLNEAPEIYDRMDYWVEAGDWIIYKLCGELRRSSGAAGYKALWSKREGYPSSEFFGALDPRLKDIEKTKLGTSIIELGSRQGGIDTEGAQITGLAEGTSVSTFFVDAHVALPGVGVTKPGQMLAVIGTSSCYMLLGEEEKTVPGICGVVEDGLLPGLIGYEAGQTCVGDHFQWFVENCTPKSYYDAAEKEGVNIYTYLMNRAKLQKPGESGLLALDWWNGNRSVLVDASLSGMILGCTLATRPEEMFRALIEATAFGMRKILETFESNDAPVEELYIAGGIAKKNPMMMQIYADILQRELKIASSSQVGALSSAMFGAVAAGKQNGGFDTIDEAVRVMAKFPDETYAPIEENSRVYDELYEEYTTLHDYFGRGENDVMKHLRAIRLNQSGGGQASP